MLIPDLNPMNGGDFIHNNERKINGGSILDRFSLVGKTAIITGAGSGIGYSVATAYAELGCNVAIWYYPTDLKAIDKAELLAQQYNVKCKAIPPEPQRQCGS